LRNFAPNFDRPARVQPAGLFLQRDHPAGFIRASHASHYLIVPVAS
jgi:hypothetical protein